MRYPEWAPEIASPDQDVDDLRAKCRFFVGEGSRLALLVLAETRRSSYSRLATLGAHSGAGPIEALVLELGDKAAAITPATIFAALYP